MFMSERRGLLGDGNEVEIVLEFRKSLERTG
jgi:hypothetical protein